MVNSISSPKTEWDRSESSPGTLKLMMKAAGVPIDRYSYEATELLRDKQARWHTMRRIRESAAFAANKDPAVAAPPAHAGCDDICHRLSFAALPDRTEFDYLNELPTSIGLTDEAVDRLRAAAGKIIMASADFQRLLKDVGARVVAAPPRAGEALQHQPRSSASCASSGQKGPWFKFLLFLNYARKVDSERR